MRTLLEIEAGWRSFADGLIEFDNVARADASACRAEIAKEVQWICSTPMALLSIPARIAKYTELQKNDKINLMDFDFWWRQRIAFFQWVLS